MRTTKAQQAKNHRLIIQTAVDLMTEHGFEGTTMKQIARAADIGDATIYKYFPTKEKLVTAVCMALAMLPPTTALIRFGDERERIRCADARRAPENLKADHRSRRAAFLLTRRHQRPKNFSSKFATLPPLRRAAAAGAEPARCTGGAPRCGTAGG